MSSPVQLPQFRMLAQLATRDYFHEWVMSVCYVLSLAAVLMPLLVLFGLKFGIISNLLEPIREDPRHREIVPIGSGDFSPQWFETMAGREDVAFVIPKTRNIAATMKLQVTDGDVGRIIDVELIPSGGGDPVLRSVAAATTSFKQVIISANVAEKLGVQSGVLLDGILSRVVDDKQELVIVPLTVIAIAPPGAFERDGIFVSIELLAAVEDYRDGRAVQAFNASGEAPRTGPRNYAGFRLYARDINDVAKIRSDLLAQQIDVRTSVADIEIVRTLDRNLSIVYWIIAIIAISGYCLSFGASLLANVDRKRHEFSLLQLIGFRSRAIMWFPVLQALLTAVLGWALATTAYLIVQSGLNALFVDNLGAGQAVCRLLPGHIVLTLLFTLLAASIAAALGGRRVVRMEPSVGLREA